MIKAAEQQFDRPFIEIIRALVAEGLSITEAAEFLDFPDSQQFYFALRSRGFIRWFKPNIEPARRRRKKDNRHRKAARKSARLARIEAFQRELDTKRFMYRGAFETIDYHARRFQRDPTEVRERYRRTKDMTYAMRHHKRALTKTFYDHMYAKRLRIERAVGISFPAVIQRLAYAGYTVRDAAQMLTYRPDHFRKLCKEEGYIQWFKGEPIRLKKKRRPLCEPSAENDPRRHRKTASWLTRSTSK